MLTAGLRRGVRVWRGGVRVWRGVRVGCGWGVVGAGGWGGVELDMVR